MEAKLMAERSSRMQGCGCTLGNGIHLTLAVWDLVLALHSYQFHRHQVPSVRGMAHSSTHTNLHTL